MSSTADILRKKMRPAVPQVGPSLVWWQGELDQVMRNVCKSALLLDVQISELDGKQMRAPEALDQMPKVVLPFLLGTKAKGAALFVLDGVLIDGMIEQQLLGEVLPTKRLERPVTAIDAGLSEKFVREAINGITTEASGPFSGLSIDRSEQDRAALRLALGEGLYDVLTAQIDMGPGIKTGKFELWLPATAAKATRSSKTRGNPRMLDILQTCEVEMETRLEGCDASAQELMNLKVGSLLTIPRSSLTQIEVSDSSGHRFAQARLGQLNGARAVLLTKLYNKSGAEPVQDLPEVATQAAITLTEVEPAPDLAAAPELSESMDVLDASSGGVGSAA